MTREWQSLAQELATLRQQKEQLVWALREAQVILNAASHLGGPFGSRAAAASAQVSGVLMEVNHG